MYTLIETANSTPASPTGYACRSLKPAPLNGADPRAWLADVLARLPEYPAKRVAELLPWNWSPPAAALKAA